MHFILPTIITYCATTAFDGKSIVCQTKPLFVRFLQMMIKSTLVRIMNLVIGKESSVSVDNDGNIYAAGSCAEIEANFNGTALPAPHLYTVYVTKYNPNGQMQWTKYIEDITCPSPIVKARTPNEVYFSSELFDSFPFDTIIPEGPTGGYFDFFLAKLNQTRNFIWVKEVPGMGSVTPGMTNSLEIDNEGNIYFGGNTRNTIQWNETISTTANGFSNDILVLKYNTSGNVIWAKTAGGNSYDQLHSISLLPDGNLVITGIAKENTTFEPLSHTPTNPNYYPFVTRLNQTTLDLPENEIKSLIVYPNPAKETITVQSNYQNGVATLHNSLGQLLKTVVITSNETTFDISELSKGAYFFKLNSDVIKIMKE